MQTCSRNSNNSNFRVPCIPSESKANDYTMTDIGAGNLIAKQLVQMVPNCVRTPRLRTLKRLRLSKSTASRAIQITNTPLTSVINPSALVIR